jgi:hypothetical protein
MGSFKMSHWNETRHHLRDQYLGDRTRKYPMSKERANYPELADSITTPALQHGGGDWELVVRPYQDAFRLDLASLETLVPHSSGWEPLYWEAIFHDLPFSSPYRGCSLVKNIVVEFDSDWNRDWPDEFEQLMDELSQRALVANLVTNLAMANIGDDPDYFIWLLDRSARQSISDKREREHIFYDLDSEFVEMDPDLSQNENGQAAARFIRELCRLGEDSWTRYHNPDSADMWLYILPWRYNACQHMGVLGRRE